MMHLISNEFPIFITIKVDVELVEDIEDIKNHVDINKIEIVF
jgi:hypothetical protein